MLHDIGMIGVSDEILYKIDALSQEEYDEIKKHITYSVKILEDIKQLKDVVEIIKYHHEKYDDTPTALKARIYRSVPGLLR